MRAGKGDSPSTFNSWHYQASSTSLPHSGFQNQSRSPHFTFPTVPHSLADSQELPRLACQIFKFWKFHSQCRRRVYSDVGNSGVGTKVLPRVQATVERLGSSQTSVVREEGYAGKGEEKAFQGEPMLGKMLSESILLPTPNALESRSYIHCYCVTVLPKERNLSRLRGFDHDSDVGWLVSKRLRRHEELEELEELEGRCYSDHRHPATRMNHETVAKNAGVVATASFSCDDEIGNGFQKARMMMTTKRPEEDLVVWAQILPEA
ncbi:hypothetical protein C8R42DRAFT_644267 [Lentinula raphanica]|nr:hypothetical protein C8R42DRAFT_644267 [Lentinula raphanica]